MIYVDTAAVGIGGIDAISGIGVEDIVFDINATQRLPKNDSLGAIVRHDVIVDLEIADGGVSGDLHAGAGVSQQNVVDDDFVFTAHVQPMIKTAPSAPVVMNVIGDIAVAAGVFI